MVGLTICEGSRDRHFGENWPRAGVFRMPGQRQKGHKVVTLPQRMVLDVHKSQVFIQLRRGGAWKHLESSENPLSITGKCLSIIESSVLFIP